MPKGSDYPGPPERLALYLDIVERHPDAEVKGAKNPYTSLNGWMTSFLDPEGAVCLRLPDEDRAALINDHGGAAVQQYGRNMPEFVRLAPTAADDEATADAWFTRSWAWTGTKPPK